MKPLSDPQLNRLLSGRDELTQADKDAALDQVLERLPAEPAERPAGLLAPWLRWGLVSLGLLLAVEFQDEKTAARISDLCLARGLFVRQTQGNMIRIFPALNIKQEEMEEGLGLFKGAIESSF